jgi:hypothetical protein
MSAQFGRILAIAALTIDDSAADRAKVEREFEAALLKESSAD